MMIQEYKEVPSYMLIHTLKYLIDVGCRIVHVIDDLDGSGEMTGYFLIIYDRPHHVSL